MLKKYNNQKKHNLMRLKRIRQKIQPPPSAKPVNQHEHKI